MYDSKLLRCYHSKFRAKVTRIRITPPPSHSWKPWIFRPMKKGPVAHQRKLQPIREEHIFSGRSTECPSQVNDFAHFLQYQRADPSRGWCPGSQPVQWLGSCAQRQEGKLFVYTPRCHPPEAQVHLVFCMLPDPRRVGEAFAQGSRGWLIVSTPRLLHQTSHMKKLLFSLLDSLRMTVPTHGEGTNCAQDFWGQEVWRKPLQTPPTTWHSRRYNSGATEFLKPLGGRLWRTGNFHVRDKHNQQPANQPNYPFQTQGRRHHHHHHLHHHHLLHQHHVNINVNFNL